jgi:hypothetical protein
MGADTACSIATTVTPASGAQAAETVLNEALIRPSLPRGLYQPCCTKTIPNSVWFSHCLDHQADAPRLRVAWMAAA